MATSSYALCRSLLPGRLSLEEHIPENWMVCWMDEMMQHEWQNGAQNLLSSKFQPVVLSWASFKEAATQATDENRNASGPFGPEHVLEENRPTLLLRLMQHALSDLQRDHRLALTVLQLMIYWKCCDDVSVLRGLLCMIMSQYKFCDGTCQERFEMGLNDEEEHDLDHYCADWTEFLKGLSRLISHGITYLTTPHVSALSAVVQVTYDSANAGAVALEEELLSQSSDARTRRKAVLKHSLFFRHHTSVYGEDETVELGERSDRGVQYDLIRAVILGVGGHAIVDKERLIQFQNLGYQNLNVQTGQTPLDPNKVLRRTIDSYSNSVRLLVDVGEISVRRLPTNHRTKRLGGLLVRSLTQIFLESDFEAFDLDTNIPYFGNDRPGLREQQVISPLRYTDPIHCATEHRLKSFALTREMRQHSNAPSVDLTRTLKIIACLLKSPPTKDIQDIIRSLFVLDLVDIQCSGCGYGDFVVWCGLPVNPLDANIFSPFANFPEDDTEGGWTTDEDGIELVAIELKARYDFTLVNLLRAWHSPWSPRNHHSFQKSFRIAVNTLALCAYRVGMPNDIVLTVSKYLPREWWPDERSKCWCDDCEQYDVNESILRKLLRRETAGKLSSKFIDDRLEQVLYLMTGGKNNQTKRIPIESFQPCPGCRVAIYCSKEHTKYAYQDGHKVVCGRPPFRIPGEEEDRLCKEVSRIAAGSDVEQNLTPPENDARSDEEQSDVDSEGSWESIDSSDDIDNPPQQQSITQAIHSFFEKKAYRELAHLE